jgi:RNA recognition motif-containing protein
MGKKLFVGNLSYQATEQDIKDLFAQAGTVESVKIITDVRSGQPRGFGFVEMSSDEDAQNAISTLHGKPFKDRPLTVSEAREQQRRPGGDRGARGR